MRLAEKKAVLEKIIRGCGSLLVSYSGGIDSTLLAVLAHAILGKNSHAVFLDSPLVPDLERDAAIRFAREYGLLLDIIWIPVAENQAFLENSPNRCYTCKKISIERLKEAAIRSGISCIADGSNASDLSEHRPGMQASSEEGVLHPFIMADISKEEIREWAREIGIPSWGKPSSACLASRIPYGETITTPRLRMIDAAENYLASKGFSQARVRLHGDIARIEVAENDLEILVGFRSEIVRKFQEIGIRYITLDLAGYRSGSMDEVL